MKIAEIIFDPKDKNFKSPTGAIKSDTELTLSVLVPKDLCPESVKAVVKYDRYDEPAYYDMQGVDTPVQTDDYLVYTTSFVIHDTGLYWYDFRIVTEGGDQIETAMHWQQTVYKRSYQVPDWICGGIFYQIFVDRFNPSGRERAAQDGKILRTDWGATPKWKKEDGRILNNDFFGGDLEGIRQKLPYLADLNVTCIYLSPVFEAYSNHKYDTANYEVIDPAFGTEDDFRALCTTASEYGIRVICDGVFAHTGSDSVYFDRYGRYGSPDCPGAYGHPESKYRSWYYFHEDGSYDCWWDFDTLPKLNKKEQSYIDYITGDDGIVRKWLRAGAAGWRLDVADELPNSFLDSLVAAAKAEKSDALIIGEVWEDASNKIAYDERKNYFEGNRLDSVMNYPFRNAIVDFVRNGNAKALARTVESISQNYPPEVLNCLMNVLGTHDSVRIITALAGDCLGNNPSREQQASTHLDEYQWQLGIRRLKIASLIQMTLPGVPCIYYGDEAGVEGYKDPFNRTCFPWGSENEDLLNWYKMITGLRRSHEIYGAGEYRTIAVKDGLYAFERFDGENRPVITAANCGGSDQILNLEGTWQDLLTGSIVEGNVNVFPGEVLLLERSI